LDTNVSAGWETIAQKTPAMYPEINVTNSCVALEYSFLGLVNTCL